MGQDMQEALSKLTDHTVGVLMKAGAVKHLD